MRSLRKLTLLVLGALAALAGGPVAAGERLSGAGATFPYPVYARWIHEYGQMYHVRIDYQSIGSGGGIAQIKAGTVDFGASDAPLSAEELEASGLVQFPMVMGGVVVVTNVPGVGDRQLRLSRELLAGIFLGRVKRWNDPAIRELNPGLSLPARPIAVVHRADGSGTTWVFTDYLSRVSPTWRSRVGRGKAVAWPVGLGGKGNEGVAAYVQRIPGAIGYVEYAYALQNHLPVALLENRDGRYVAPSAETFQAAAADADWAGTPGMAVVLADQPGADSWPLTAATFILLHREQRDCARARALLEFFDWCYRHGGDTAEKLDYVPLPPQVVQLVEKRWGRELHCNGRPVWE